MAKVYISNLVIYTGTKFEQTFVLEDTQTNSVMNLTGYKEQGPIRTGAPIVDYGVALAASFAISSALFKYKRALSISFIAKNDFAVNFRALTDLLSLDNMLLQISIASWYLFCLNRDSIFSISSSKFNKVSLYMY